MVSYIKLMQSNPSAAGRVGPDGRVGHHAVTEGVPEATGTRLWDKPGLMAVLRRIGHHVTTEGVPEALERHSSPASRTQATPRHHSYR